jgi:hypothetical protein
VGASRDKILWSATLRASGASTNWPTFVEPLSCIEISADSLETKGRVITKMRTVRFRFLRCGHEGEVQILSPEEQRDPSIPRRPVTCPECGSPDVEVG